jgi:hypothetical protein
MLGGIFITPAVVLAGAEGPPAGLSDQSFASWRDRTRPQAAERCFETAHRLPTFWDGVMAARQEDKPIALCRGKIVAIAASAQ